MSNTASIDESVDRISSFVTDPTSNRDSPRQLMIPIREMRQQTSSQDDFAGDEESADTGTGPIAPSSSLSRPRPRPPHRSLSSWRMDSAVFPFTAVMEHLRLNNTLDRGSGSNEEEQGGSRQEEQEQPQQPKNPWGLARFFSRRETPEDNEGHQEDDASFDHSLEPPQALPRVPSILGLKTANISNTSARQVRGSILERPASFRGKCSDDPADRSSGGK